MNPNLLRLGLSGRTIGIQGMRALSHRLHELLELGLVLTGIDDSVIDLLARPHVFAKLGLVQVPDQWHSYGVVRLKQTRPKVRVGGLAKGTYIPFGSLFINKF